MARPNKLNPRQIGEIKDKKLKGATLVELAKEYKVGFATISRLVSERVSEMEKVAKSIAKAKEPLKDFDVMERASITQRADDLLEISQNLGKAAKSSSATAARLSIIAEKQSLQINEFGTIEENAIPLKNVMMITQVANEAAKIPLNLLAANKEAIKDLNETPEDNIPNDLGFLYGE